MIDGAVLAGYLAVAATGRGFDVGADALFGSLAMQVEQRLGVRALADVEAAPGDVERQRRLGRGIDAIARADPQLARDLTTLQDELDRKVGRQFIDAVRALPVDEPAQGEPVTTVPAGSESTTIPHQLRRRGQRPHHWARMLTAVRTAVSRRH